MANTSLNLSALNDEEFEDLIDAIFRARMLRQELEQPVSVESFQLSVVSVSRSGRGTDEGLDLLVTTLVRDCIAPREIRWLIQCKHKAVSGRAVSPSDFANDFSFIEIVKHHDANSYLLACSTRPSTKLQSRLDKLTKDNQDRQFIIWDAARVCEEVLRHEELVKRFFPREYQRQRDVVDGGRVRDWMLQYKEAISPDACDALSQIIAIDKADTAEMGGQK